MWIYTLRSIAPHGIYGSNQTDSHTPHSTCSTIQNIDIFRKGTYNTCLRFVSTNVASQYWKIISISNQIDLSKHFVQICIDVTTGSFLLIYSYRRSLYGDCRASAKWQVRNIWFVASQTVFRLQKIWVKKLKHSLDYLACLTNMLQSENFTSYLIGTYWAQWLEHAKKN